MSSWSKSGLTKKEIINKFKISIFEHNVNHAQIYASEIICSGHVNTLIDICIEIWTNFYIFYKEISVLLYHSIELLKGIKHKEFYKSSERYIVLQLCTAMCFCERKQLNGYTKKCIDNHLHIESENIPKYYQQILKNIKSYVNKEAFDLIVKLLVTIYNKDIHNINTILSQYYDIFVSKNELEQHFETIHTGLTKNYIWILFFVLQKMYTDINDNNYLDVFHRFTEIFQFSINKKSIKIRMNIIFALFQFIIEPKIFYQFENNDTNYSHKTIQSEVDDIFEKLISFYKMNEDKAHSQNSKNTAEDKSNSKNSKSTKEKHDIYDNFEYLYTITYKETFPQKKKCIPTTIHDCKIINLQMI